jgi:hypothetical protein
MTVTPVEDEERVPDEEFDSASGLYFSIDLGLDNRRLNVKQRAALRAAVQEVLGVMTTKLMMMDIIDRVSLTAVERSSTYGARPLRVPQEVTSG